MIQWVTHIKLFILKRLYNPKVVLSTETTELGANHWDNDFYGDKFPKVLIGCDYNYRR